MRCRVKDLRKCDCCGAYTISEPHDICPFCGWEDDPYQRKNPDDTGANSVTLIEARANFKRFGRAEAGDR